MQLLSPVGTDQKNNILGQVADMTSNLFPTEGMPPWGRDSGRADPRAGHSLSDRQFSLKSEEKERLNFDRESLQSIRLSFCVSFVNRAVTS